MTPRPSRRSVLAGCGALLVPTAGCFGSVDGGGRSRTDSGPTPIGADSWPVDRWESDHGSPFEELLADPSAGVVYGEGEEGVLAYGADGERRWERSLDGGPRETIDGAVLADGGELLALEADSGDTRWSFATDSESDFPAVAVHEGAVYAVASRVDTGSTRVDEPFARLYRVDAASGEATELGDLPGAPSESWVAAGAGEALYLAREDGLVVSYDATGTERWRTDLRTGEEEPTRHTVTVTEEEPEPDHPTPEYTTGDNLAIAFGGVADGTLAVGVRGGLETVHGLATDTGDLRWEHRGYGAVESVAPDRVLVSGGSDVAGGRLAAVDPASGALRWTRTIDRGFLDERYGVTADGVHYDVLRPDDRTPTLIAIDVATGDTVGKGGSGGGPIVGPVSLGDLVVYAAWDEDAGGLQATPLLDAEG